ncbi:hypothetical protein WJX73_009764 [Symbiochloris irregularis]|uniref:Uncharacterized protein n=1 Tax=Symbiochloris irregularis TaxID=706552 RepID=A0AAW1PJ21_9CHLO
MILFRSLQAGHWAAFSAATRTLPLSNISAGQVVSKHDAKRVGRRWVAAPQRAIRSVKNQLAATASKSYQASPKQVQRLVDSLAKPGSTQKVLKLHLEAFWTAHGNKVIGAVGLLLIYYLWRGMFGLTSMFLNLSETMAEFGFLALAAAMAAFLYLYLSRRWTINADSVYRIALRRLNTDPGVLEVMGAPVAGSDVRASVSTGGGLRLKGLWPALRSRRLQMIFPLTGSDRRGLVSLEAKKRGGSYLFKLLAVDVPTSSGAEQRLFLEGDARAYDRGGVMRELRDPFLQALAMREAYEEEDDVDDAAEEAHQAQADREAVAAAVQPLQAGAVRPANIQPGAAATPAASRDSSTFVADRVSGFAKSVWASFGSSQQQQPTSSSGS